MLTANSTVVITPICNAISRLETTLKSLENLPISGWIVEYPIGRNAKPQLEAKFPIIFVPDIENILIKNEIVVYLPAGNQLLTMPHKPSSATIINNIGDWKKNGTVIMTKEAFNDKSKRVYSFTQPLKIMPLANWTTSGDLISVFARQSQGNARWDNIQLISDENLADYFIIFNRPRQFFDPKLKSRTILAHMEPYVEQHPEIWGREWSTDINMSEWLSVRNYSYKNNICEWHLGKTYQQLLVENISKTKTLSAIVSGRNVDPGQIFRLKLVKKLDELFMIDIFGRENSSFTNYRGPLPPHDKTSGLFPYKYTFNAENNAIDNYFTEKVFDAILSECLLFYWGCPNLSDFIDERAYVQLDINDLDKSVEIIIKAIENNLWEERLPIIKTQKQKILNELNLFPMLNDYFTKKYHINTFYHPNLMDKYLYLNFFLEMENLYFLDIGTVDGLETLFFERHLGWKGILFTAGDQKKLRLERDCLVEKLEDPFGRQGDPFGRQVDLLIIDDDSRLKLPISWKVCWNRGNSTITVKQ